ncbi:DUF294 nucleotidyltransferase-like domain-containing protein [Alphaproteobacteria bacterium]|nr:DUF294 nucleotidyltransferase-like domain-containing protein [Alphaproteobacteria bacterium]
MSLSSVLLEKLPLISLDLETTGLQTRTDRVVQIGAIDPYDATNYLDMLVNPDMAIPPRSTDIHGISDDMVADKPLLTQAFPRLRDSINDRVVIGYNIGFDLAIIAAETDRHGIAWDIPPALCVRQMATIALGRDAIMMMGTLETLAQHFEIPLADRHTAIGDAIMTGKLFRALLVELKTQGINTYADLQKATATLDDQRIAGTNAGWVDVAAIQQPYASFRALSRIDPFPYSHKIDDLMITKPLIMPPDSIVLDAAYRMKQEKRECVFVGTSPDQVIGIVSERDIVHCMALPVDEVTRARDIRLSSIMASPVLTVSEDDYMHVAMARMQKHDIRHLGVTNPSGAMTGYISGRELNRLRLTDAMIIGDDINQAENGDDMGNPIKGLPLLSQSLLDEGLKAYAIASVISSQYRAALARSAALAEQIMCADELPPPAEYAVLILGSAGREESLLAADQDHAIIYDLDKKKQNRLDLAATQQWFEQLGQHIADIMNSAGIPYCTGGVMANTATWCKSLTDWTKTVRGWISRGSAKDVLHVDIFFDYHCVYGAQHLADTLQKLIIRIVRGQLDFLKLLASNIQSQHAGISFWGGFVTENGRFNVKRNLLLPITESLRVLSVSRSISIRNSVERAEQLMAKGNIPPEIILLAEDLQFCIKLVLRQQINDISKGLAPTTLIDLGALSSREKKTLKSVQGRVKHLEQLLFDCLFG